MKHSLLLIVHMYKGYPCFTDVRETPVLSLQPSSPYYIGDGVTMSCQSPRDGNPPAEKFSWFKDTEGIREDSNVGVVFISIDDVTQEGGYSCQAINNGYQGWMTSEMSSQTNINIRGIQYL